LERHGQRAAAAREIPPLEHPIPTVAQQALVVVVLVVVVLLLRAQGYQRQHAQRGVCRPLVRDATPCNVPQLHFAITASRCEEE
jgi:hypothetical protein